MTTIDVLVDVNPLADLVREYPNLDEAMKAGAGEVLALLIKHGADIGLRLHSGEHILRALETVLTRTLEKNGGVNWSKLDAHKWRRLVEQAVLATGGRIDVKSDLTMRQAGHYVTNRDLPDEEDAHVLRIAEIAGAQVIVTHDGLFAKAQTDIMFVGLSVLVRQINNSAATLAA